MRIRWMSCGVVALAALAAPAQKATAQAPSLAGTWTLDAERSQDPQEAIMAAFGGGGGMMRGGAGGGGGVAMRGGGGGGGGGGAVIRSGGPGGGGGMMDMLQGGRTVQIELSGESVTLHVDDDAPFMLPLSGASTPITRWGRQVEASARLSESTLTIETTAQNGPVLKEVFAASVNREIDAELHVTVPMVLAGGGGEERQVVIRRVYVAR